MEKQIGITVFDGAGKTLGTLWQHLDADEAEINLTEDHQGSLGYILSDWSGDWTPARPIDLEAIETYKLVSRAGEKR